MIKAASLVAILSFADLATFSGGFAPSNHRLGAFSPLSLGPRSLGLSPACAGSRGEVSRFSDPSQPRYSIFPPSHPNGPLCRCPPLAHLKGEIRIVDPYCGERTLDVLRDVKGSQVRFLTRLDNLGKRRSQFVRELGEFKLENLNVEFRDYPYTDIHDRYIISSDLLVILGHSIKDLGTKESFGIVLRKGINRDIVEVLIGNFEARWKESTPF